MKKSISIVLFLIFIKGFFQMCFADNNAVIRDPFATTQTPLQTVSKPAAMQPSLPLQSIWIPLYFAKADDILHFINNKSAGFLSAQGKINSDKRGNQLWIEDDAKHIDTIRAVVKHLDQPSPQFLIRAKIVNVDRNYQKVLGFLFQTKSPQQKVSRSLTMNEPDTTSAGEFNFTIATLDSNNLLNLQLSALEQEGHASLISSPALTTLENEPAIIQSGAEVPYQHATSSGATSVTFKKAVLRLQVTPKRMPDDHILLHIALNQDKVSDLTVNGTPAIETQKISTQVVIKDNQTIVLGGILETSHTTQVEGIPVIDDIPVFGALFRHHLKQTKRRELLIFITPSMMKALY